MSSACFSRMHNLPSYLWHYQVIHIPVILGILFQAHCVYSLWRIGIWKSGGIWFETKQRKTKQQQQIKNAHSVVDFDKNVYGNTQFQDNFALFGSEIWQNFRCKIPLVGKIILLVKGDRLIFQSLVLYFIWTIIPPKM